MKKYDEKISGYLKSYGELFVCHKTDKVILINKSPWDAMAVMHSMSQKLHGTLTSNANVSGPSPYLGLILDAYFNDFMKSKLICLNIPFLNNLSLYENFDYQY